ncbi:hypothetical protein N0V93_005073 [Gnomoniopsis smithogilvyi]|uniref:Zn(2)-C6 fungal-type domain-containing protein n=1 Tax=Gnomoniopsis smithogilvyi TaxID=1191159 RepID=A0A9W8YTS2_9PEZI|nr:hypothetical protein N0V93_005073 [Gnomoniopsis smithogilvyi]
MRSMPSGRKGSKKVRTGCVTCKIRKVKCDETKPFCLRCTKTGRKCDGYLDPKALTKRRGPRDVAPHDHVLSPLLEFAAPEEQRAFCFFQHSTAPCISGDFDTEFWRVIVLQISQTEPAVRHAVLAVSSLHEGLDAGSSDGALSHPQQSFALQQYNKAISRLLDQMNNPLTKPLASLLTCVLFVCIEYLQGKDKESLIHLEQGRQLLARLKQRSNDPDMECIVRHIVPLYTRLSLTSFLFGGSPVPIPDALKPQGDIPVTFDSMDSMRHSMHEFMEQAFRFTHNARPAKNHNDFIPLKAMKLLEVEQGQLLSRLAKLNVAFSLFRAARSNPSPESALLVLEMYLHAQHIWISTALSSSEVVYDNFLPAFAAIVPLAAAYLDVESSSQHHSPQSSRCLAVPEQLSVAHTRNFTFETHIIPPLYYVATKCRHPLIRRSALDLLRRNPSRRENLWRASVMGALAGHIVSLEERWSQRQGSPIIGRSISGTHNHDGFPEQIEPSHEKYQYFGRYSTAHGKDRTLSTIPATAVSASTPTLTFQAPTGSSLPMHFKESSILSHPPPLTAISEEGFSASSLMDASAAFLSTPEDSDTWLLQQQKQQPDRHRFHHELVQSDYNPIAPHEIDQPQSHQYAEDCSADYPSRSDDSSEISSVDVEEQQSDQSMGPCRSPLQQYQSQQFQHQHIHSSMATTWAPLQQQQSSLPTDFITEAPFGLPEETRVHDAIIGPEREDGTWVAVFRKLHGVDQDWDVQNDWVSTI